MTAPHIIDPAGLLGEALSQASPDLMRSLLQHVINALLSADADTVCGAQWGQQDPQRHTQRNGYRYRPLDTRVGTIDVAIPKLRSGTYFPEWLLQRRKRSENALITVVADCYLAGVSTRRMDKLVKTLGITGLSKSQVSRMAADLDEHVDEFRHRPLHDAGPFTFVAADALTMKVREGGRVVSCAVLVATGVNNDGHREVLGVRVSTSETGPAWNEFFADLVARGLTGVRLVTSDAHLGLVEAIAANLPGATWQRCRTHYAGSRMRCCWRGVSRQDLVCKHPAGLVEGIRGPPAPVVEFLLMRLRHSSRASPARCTTWKGFMTALAPGGSLAAVLLNPVNPSIATISMRSRHVLGRRPARL